MIFPKTKVPKQKKHVGCSVLICPSHSEGWHSQLYRFIQMILNIIYSEHNHNDSIQNKTTFPICFQTGRRWPWRLLSHLSPSARVTMKNLCQREVQFCLQLHLRLLDLRTCREYDILIWHRPDKIWSSSWILTSEVWVGRRGLNMVGSFIPPINPQKLSWKKDYQH